VGYAHNGLTNASQRLYLRSVTFEGRKQCFSAQKAMFYDSQSVGLFLEELEELKVVRGVKGVKGVISPLGLGVKADSFD